MSGVSFGLLFYFTIMFLLEAIDTIWYPEVECVCDTSYESDPTTCWKEDNEEKIIGQDNCKPEDEVNAYIVLGERAIKHNTKGCVFFVILSTTPT